MAILVLLCASKFLFPHVSCLSHVLLTLLIGFGAVSSWTMLTGVHNFENGFWLPNASVFEVVFSVCLGLLLFSEARYVDVKEVSLSVAPRLWASSGSTQSVRSEEEQLRLDSDESLTAPWLWH